MPEDSGKLSVFDNAAIFLASLPEDIAFQFKLHFKFAQLERLQEAAEQSLSKDDVNAEIVVADFIGMDVLLTPVEVTKFVTEHFEALLLRIKRAVYPTGDEELACEAIRGILVGKPVPVGALFLSNLKAPKIADVLSSDFSAREKASYVRELESIYIFHNEPEKTFEEVVKRLADQDDGFALIWKDAGPHEQVARYGRELLREMRKIGRIFEDLCIISEKRISDVLRLATDSELAVLLRCEKGVLKDKFFTNMPELRLDTIQREISRMPAFTILDSWNARELVGDLVRRIWTEEEVELLEKGKRRMPCPECRTLALISVEKRRLVVTCRDCGEMFIVRPDKELSRKHSEARIRLSHRLRLPFPTVSELQMLVREFNIELSALREKIKEEYFGYPRDAQDPEPLSEKLEEVFNSFGKNLAQNLSRTLFINCSMTLDGIAEKTCYEATMSLPEFANIYIMRVSESKQKILLQISDSLNERIVELYSDAHKRWVVSQGLPLGPAERRVFHHFIDVLAEEFSAAAEIEPKLKLDIDAFFNTPADVEDIPMDELMIEGAFKFVVDNVQGDMHLCVPITLLRKFFKQD